MIKARIKADDKQQKEEFHEKPRVKKKKGNDKNEKWKTRTSTYTPYSQESKREREQRKKEGHPIFQDHESRGYKDTPELRLDYNFR